MNTDPIEQQIIELAIDKFTKLNYDDALRLADVPMSEALEHAIKIRDEAQIGYWFMRIIEAHAKDANLDNISEAINDYEQELREAS